MSECPKDRKFCGILYPDSESYCCEEIIALLHEVFPQFAYILHDKDIWDSKDEEKNPEHVSGSLKKPHIHWVGRFKSAPRYISAIAADIGIAENNIERCRGFEAHVRYLVHKDDPEKYQYDLTEVHSTFPLYDYFKECEEVQAVMIMDHIDQTNERSMQALARWCAKNHCWTTLRRGGPIWPMYLRENGVLE